MKYLEMVSGCSSKLMLDLAYILDDVLFQMDETKDEYQRAHVAALREEVFHDFCALCVQSGIPVPAMEENIISAQMPKVGKEVLEHHAIRVETFVKPVLGKLGRKKSAKANLCRSFAECFANLPCLSARYSGQVSTKQMECAINMMLIELGMEPIRPDYKSREVKGARESSKKEKKVVIVDDDSKEILKTARALAGWGGLNLSFYRYKSEFDRWSMKPEQRQAELSRAAQAVAEMKPDVVLMDQGLDAIDGSDLILKMRELYSHNGLPVFVGNTGGTDDKLRGAGALENCNKGQNLQGVARAVL